MKETFPTAGFTNLRKLYIIAGKDKNIPEKRAIDKYRIKGACGERYAKLALLASFTICITGVIKKNFIESDQT